MYYEARNPMPNRIITMYAQPATIRLSALQALIEEATGSRMRCPGRVWCYNCALGAANRLDGEREVKSAKCKARAARSVLEIREISSMNRIYISSIISYHGFSP